MSRAAAVRRVSRICETAQDALGLRVALVAELRQSLGFDAYAFLLTDPVTCVGAAPLADVPSVSELPRLIRLKYLTPTNRWTGLDGVPVRSLHTATGGELHRSLMWRELLSEYAVIDVASLVLRDRHGCWGFLDLWRTGRTTPFNADDAALLTDIATPVTSALRRVQAGTFVARPPATHLPGPVVLLLSPDLEVRAQTPQTQQYLRVLIPPPGDQPPIPASAYNVAAQLLALEAGVDTHPASARVHLSDSLWLTLRAARIDSNDATGEHDIAVTIEVTSPGDRLDLFVRAFALSAREAELVGHLVAGHDTRDVATAMSLSPHTVQDHLKSIFEKTATTSRRALLSRALGTALGT